VFFVSSNQTGPWGELRFLGGAKIVDPDGIVLARTGAQAGMATARVDLAEVRESRLAIDHLADRRPDAYATFAHPAAALAVTEPSSAPAATLELLG